MPITGLGSWVTTFTMSLALYCLVTWIRNRGSAQIRAFLTGRIAATKENPDIEPGRMSRTFAEQNFTTPKISTTHSHARSAGVRTSAVTFIRQLILTMGLQEYCVSMSNRDQAEGLKGVRHYFWSKDTDKEARNDTKTSEIMSMVDVDFHVDELHGMITGSATPIVLSTINPVQVATSIGEATYYFDECNRFCMEVVGGGSYRHQLWDYTPDIVHTTTTNFFGITNAFTTFKVEKRQLDDYRQIVCLIPIGTWRGYMALVAKYLLHSSPLTRFEPVINGWAHIIHSTTKGIFHSIGKASTHQEATFTAAEFENLVTVGALGKNEATVTATAPWLSSDRTRGLIAAEYLRARVDRGGAYATRVEDSVQQISSSVLTFGDEEEKKGVTGFMQPLIDGACYAHTKTQDNGRWGVEARITSLAKSSSAMAPFPTRCVREFVEHLTASGPLTPVSVEEVRIAQSRPTQQVLVDEGSMSGNGIYNIVRSFMKMEANSGIKDPRIISTLPALTKLEYSRYMRAVGAHLKGFKWYAFKTPELVADRMAEMLMDSDYAIEGDFSRMDGNVDRNVRTILEQALLRRWFPGDDHVLDLHSKQYNQTGIISGHAYEGGYARCSGSAETSSFNTILTAAIAYVRNRMHDLTPNEAFANLGLLGGDDSALPGLKGVSPQDDARIFSKAARALGQKLTCDIKLVGEPVVMLSRVFGGAWYGSNNSMASPLRALSKIHATANMPAGVSPAQKCHEKGLSLLATDAYTPILGALGRKMVSTGEPVPQRFKDVAQSHWMQFDTSWPNFRESWMDEVIAQQMPDFDHQLFNDWCDNGEPLEAPVCMALEASPGKRDAIVDGVLVPSADDGVSNRSDGTVSVYSGSETSSGRKPRKKTFKARVTVKRTNRN